MKFRNPYVRASHTEGIRFTDESLTVQSEKDSCDVNKIMRNYRYTGVLPESREASATYADVSAMPTTYDGMLEAIQQAEDSFMEIPAVTRRYFDNNPGKYLAFMESTDQNDIEKSYELGLRIRPKVEVKDEPVSPSPVQDAETSPT
ncbi:internal scaffolding protein [Peromfec virus RodF7_16]|uniref:Internal scaffolding protein n=1 Tax=Peromfec virus RodF7_16 TaxID=2929351 RepID=A0A976N2E4_9VIRU|nr:internal scaffolding protein [Peromfec virus RodF7_16]